VVAKVYGVLQATLDETVLAATENCLRRQERRIAWMVLLDAVVSVPTLRRRLMNKERAENAVRELLLALDQDINSEGLKDTPRRVAEMYATQCADAESFEYRAFQEVKHEELVLVRNIPIASFCQHHLVPWYGRAFVAYIPHKKLLGLSKLARLVYACSVGFTTQEGVTKMVADKLYDEFEPLGVMVVINASHTCMNLRGARAFGASTITSAVRGVMRDVPAARQEVLSLIGEEIKQ
jgi:GTP cyclohydrolase I